METLKKADEIDLVLSSNSEVSEIISELEQFCELIVLRDLSILTLVSVDIKAISGLEQRMTSSLEDAGIQVVLKGSARENSISCVVPKEDSIKGINAIHNTCVFGQEPCAIL